MRIDATEDCNDETEQQDEREEREEITEPDKTAELDNAMSADFDDEGEAGLSTARCWDDAAAIIGEPRPSEPADKRSDRERAERFLSGCNAGERDAISAGSLVARTAPGKGTGW
mgnify:CR=1 FL=1